MAKNKVLKGLGCLTVLFSTVFFGNNLSLGYYVPDPCPCGPIGPENSFKDIRPSENTRPSPTKITRPPPRDTQREAERREFLKKLFNDHIVKVRTEQVPPVHVSYESAKFYSGSKFFVRKGEKGESIQIDTGKIPTSKISGTSIASGNLQRAVGILGKFFRKGSPFEKSGEGLSGEDIKFLADQAGLAMNGAPLQIDVPVTSVPHLTREQEEILMKGMVRIEEDLRKVDEMVRTRRDFENKLRDRQNKIEQQEKGKGLAAMLIESDREFSQLKKDYDKILLDEQKARQKLEEDKNVLKEQVEVIMVP